VKFKVDKKVLETKEIKMIVIGATGAGKTSLINLLYVWSKGLKKVVDIKEVLIDSKYLPGKNHTENKDTSNHLASMTQYSSNYYFELIHDQICYKLTFMDTPGLGDSRGLDQDDKNITNILDTISKTPELNAIVVMVNGSDPRGNTRIKYIITRLMGILPNAVQNNIVVLLSNVATEPNLNMQKLMIDLGMPKLSNENVFYFDNPIFSIDFSKYNTKQLEKYDNIFLELEDKLAQFLQHTSQKRMEKTTEFRQIKEKRDLLKDQMAIIKINIKDLQEEKEKTENFISELESLKDLKKAKELIKIGKQSQSTYEQIPTPYHNTRCQQCNSNCHENCGLEETTNTGSLSFLQCLAFKKKTLFAIYVITIIIIMFTSDHSGNQFKK